MKRGVKRKDYIGQTFGKLTIIEDKEDKISSNGIKIRYVLCRCECGVEKIIRLCDVVAQQTKSCGGVNCRSWYKKARKKYVGKSYGLLTIMDDNIYTIVGDGIRVRFALCRCKCGKEKVIALNSVMNGNTRSCGCVGRGVGFDKRLNEVKNKE